MRAIIKSCSSSSARSGLMYRNSSLGMRGRSLYLWLEQSKRSTARLKTPSHELTDRVRKLLFRHSDVFARSIDFVVASAIDQLPTVPLPLTAWFGVQRGLHSDWTLSTAPGRNAAASAALKAQAGLWKVLCENRRLLRNEPVQGGRCIDLESAR